MPACFPCADVNYGAAMLFQDYLSGLYRSLALPLGAEFSLEDVALIYRQVFHLPSSTTDARAAMQKVGVVFSFFNQQPFSEH